MECDLTFSVVRLTSRGSPSLSTTRKAPSSAAQRPQSPTPAPSSRTERPAQRGTAPPSAATRAFARVRAPGQSAYVFFDITAWECRLFTNHARAATLAAGLVSEDDVRVQSFGHAAPPQTGAPPPKQS